MSDRDQPDVRAFRELETLVRHLGEELAAFRRRAIAAEAQLRDSGQTPRPRTSGGSERPSDVESENEALKKRLSRAEDRVRQMLDRVRFLRQQMQSQATPVAAGRS